MKKQNKALYESLVNGIASALKKSLNEGIESFSNIPSEYYDEDGLIDLTNLSSFPKEFINSLILDLLKNSDLDWNDHDDNCYMCAIMPDTSADNKGATILTRSMEEYGVLLSFNATFDADIKYDEYDPGDHWTAPSGGYPEIQNTDIVISGLMLENDFDSQININDPEIIKKVRDMVDGSKI